MKPLGPIPAGFDAVDGILAIDGIKVTDLVERAGATPTWRALVAAEGGAPQPHQWAYMYWKKHYFS